jgi:hypothetical protein
MDAVITARKQRGRPFPRGRSGNPSGRPIGARNKTTLAAEALLDNEAEVLTRTIIEKAKQGDITALRLCLDRILPARRQRTVSFRFPVLRTAAEATQVMTLIAEAVGNGNLTPGEAAELGKFVESFVRTLQANDFEKRICALEQKEKGG